MPYAVHGRCRIHQGQHLSIVHVLEQAGPVALHRSVDRADKPAVRAGNIHLIRHGLHVAGKRCDLVSGPGGVLEDLVLPLDAIRRGRSLAEHEVFMVAAQQVPAFGTLQIQNPFQALSRLWAPIDDVSGHNHFVRPTIEDIANGRFQSG